MVRFLAALAAVVTPLAAMAEGWVAARTIRAGSLVESEDLAAAPGGGAAADALPLGLEAKVTVFAGQPIRASDFGPPARVERNQIVPLYYASGALVIVTDARALERGAAGMRVRAMNLASRTVITATVTPDGALAAGPAAAPTEEMP